MYRKPGIHEVELGFQAVAWAQRIYDVTGANTSWETNVRDLFKDMSTNLQRRFRFLQLEDVVTAKSPASALGSDSQLAFAHLLSRWLTHLKILPEYPAILKYSMTPFMTLDECVDSLIGKKIVWPEWNDLGDPEAKLEAVIPVFLALIRSLVAQATLRGRYAQRLQSKVSDLGYRIAGGAPLDQFERSFFLAFADSTSPFAASKYHTISKAMKLIENSDPKVEETFTLLKSCVEAGPYTRFGVGVSNKLQQELFAFFGPYTPILEFHYGYGTKCGQFRRMHVDEKETFSWSMEAQEDAIRMQSQQLAPDVGSILSVAQPFVVYTAQRKQFRNDPAATYAPRLDVPDATIRMAEGYKSSTAQYEIDWLSPTRGRQISTSRGANAEVFLQDLATQKDRFGEGQVGTTSLAGWRLIDPSCFKSSESGLRGKVDDQINYKERIMYISAEGGTVEEREIDLEAFYTVRGDIMLRPAFTEYVAVHRNELRVAEPGAESAIVRSLDLSRGSRRRSEQVIRLSHRWNVIKRLFGVEVMSWNELRQLAQMAEGTVTPSETVL